MRSSTPGRTKKIFEISGELLNRIYVEQPDVLAQPTTAVITDKSLTLTWRYDNWYVIIIQFRYTHDSIYVASLSSDAIHSHLEPILHRYNDVSVRCLDTLPSIDFLALVAKRELTDGSKLVTDNV